jgi:hypothetical protein
MSRARRRASWALVAALPVLAVAGVELTSAAFSGGSANPANDLRARSDWSPPVASASVIAKASGGSGGYIRPGASYHVYATVTDSGNPPSGTSTVTADVSSVTSGQTAAPLLSGSFSVDGGTYTHRSAALTANAALADRSHAYTLALRDGADNTAARTGLSVVGDSTPANATDLHLDNAAGGTRGKPEAGDQLVLTYSEPVDPTTVLAAWTGTATGAVVRITDGGSQGNDILTIRNAAGTAQLPLGSIDLRRRDFVTATRDFSASTMSRNAATISVVLGTPNGATGTVTVAGTMLWTPSSSVTDRAGNPTSLTAVAETGTADLDF